MNSKKWFSALSLSILAATAVEAQQFPSYTTEVVTDAIEMPWGMAWLPNGDMLVTDRNGELFRVANGQVSAPIAGVPEVHVNGQGGLLDIEAHPDYASNGWLYLTFSDPEGNGEGSNTSVMRAKLNGNSLTEQEIIYRAMENSTRGQHYGGRMVFDEDGYLYFSIGDRGDHFNNVQNLSRDGGKIYRIMDDGSIPEDNPFVHLPDAIPAVWSYGHRNPQGIALNPATGEIWNSEHGPRGGDEINIARAANNYGWPYVGYGINYNGEPLAEDSHGAGMEQPIWYWNPSIAIAGIEFVDSDRYPELSNNLLVGALAGTRLVLLEVWDDRVIRSTDILTGLGRVREVEQGPDGYVYLAVEGGGIHRLLPSN